jgi:hypothetical protein
MSRPRILLAVLVGLVLAHASVHIHLSAAELAAPVLAAVAVFGAGSVVLVRLIVSDRRAGWRPSAAALPGRCPGAGTRRCCEPVAAPGIRKGQPWSP